MDTSVKRTPKVGPYLSLPLLTPYRMHVTLRRTFSAAPTVQRMLINSVTSFQFIINSIG